MKPRLQIPTPNFEIREEVNGACRYIIYAEMNEVGEVSTFYKAILSVYFLYWNFHLEYDEDLLPFFQAFDEFKVKGRRR